MKAGINLEQMEEVLKDPEEELQVQMALGQHHQRVNETSGGSDGGSRRIGWKPKFEVNDPRTNCQRPRSFMDRTILCDQHYNGNGDENLPTDFTRMDKGYGKTCILCSANEMSDKYFLWPPENQRTQILTMAARLAEEGNPVTDPHAKFVQFRKDITLCNDGQ